MALTVERFVIVHRLLAIFSAWYARRRALLDQSVAEPVAVVTAIGDQGGCSRQARQQRLSALVVADLAGGEMQQDRPPGLVADGVQFGVQAAFGASQTAGKAPF
jgi:hypothetical protein